MQLWVWFALYVYIIQYERQQREKMELEESRKQAMVAMAMVCVRVCVCMLVMPVHNILFRFVTVRDCNPGTIFQSRDFGIEKRQSRDPGIDPGIGN